jgi:hypothetical protein
VSDVRPLLLDSSFLVSYERDKTRRTQGFLLEAITDARILLVTGLSVTATAAELSGKCPELNWLLNDSAGPIQVLPLSATNALEVGALIGPPEKADLTTAETAQIVYESGAIRAVVLTHEPDRYNGHPIHVVDMRRSH